jgi:hypothetical protein
MGGETDRWTGEGLDTLIRKAAKIDDPGDRIAFISEQFLGVGYRESTLIGSEHIPEELVAEPGAVDCFTFLDYVEAMRLSRSASEFIEALKMVRYQGGTISFTTRNHFFTDWAVYNAQFVRDVTGEVGSGRQKSIQKVLNVREDEMLFLPGIEPVSRTLSYIPPDLIDDEILQRLRTGDYAGIYTGKAGLDVSHVGIIIRDRNTIVFRHASSATHARRVVDQDFQGYMSGKAGLIILRPKHV